MPHVIPRKQALIIYFRVCGEWRKNENFKVLGASSKSMIFTLNLENIIHNTLKCELSIVC
jgi:hypothetical protein